MGASLPSWFHGWTSLCLLCLLAFGTADAAPAPAGHIDLVTGELQVLQAGKPARQAHAGDVVFEGDTLVTGKDSEAHVTMSDTGFIALRADTRVQILSFRADGGDEDKGVFKLFSGAMRSISGWIGKFNRPSYLLRTPTATIGIRGTDHETRYIPPGSAAGEAGTYDKVFIGETTIQSDVGQTTVDPNQVGFAASEGSGAPRVLASVPGFFHPGPHEDLINRKHAEIQQMIVQRREERRKLVEQRRAELQAARQDMQTQAAANKAAAEARNAALAGQRQDTEQQTAALRARSDALQQRVTAIQEKRKALQANLAPALRRNVGLREEFKRVWDTARGFAPEYQAIREARQAISARGATATDARNAAAEAQHKQSEARLAELSRAAQALQQRQQALQAAGDSLERQASAMKPAELAQQRQTLREQHEALAADQRQNQDGFDKLFYDNIAAAQARLLDARQQLQQNEEESAALNEREVAARERQRINEDKLEALQARVIDDLGGDQALRSQLGEIHEAVEAVRAERLDLQGERMALHDRNVSASRQRQAEALEQLEAMRAKHRSVEDRRTDLQNEVKAMQEEIRGLFEQEQKRYREELRLDREQGAALNPATEQ